MNHTEEVKEKSEKKKILQKSFLKLGLIFLGVLVIFNTYQLATLGGTVQSVDKYNQGVVKELGGIRNDVMTFAADLNEIRSFLLLPTKDYSFTSDEGENSESNGEEQNNSQTAAAIYGFWNKLENEEIAAKNGQKANDTIQNILASENFKKELTANSLTASAIENNETVVSFKIISNGLPLFGVLADKKTANISVQSVLGPQAISATTPEEFSTKIGEYVKANKQKVEELKKVLDQVKADLFATVKQPTWVELQSKRKISFVEAPEETEASINYSFVNADQEKVLTLKILRASGQIEMNGQTYVNIKNITGELQKQLETIDTSSAVEKMIKERRTELETVFKEEAFQDLLKKNEFTITDQPREEYNKLLYDVKDKEGKVVFSFVIELSSGAYKVLKDNTEIDLFGALQDDGSKKKP